MEKRGVNSRKMEAVDMEIGVNSDSIGCSAVYHVVSDVLAFLLYMHHQIPAMLQDMVLEFDLLQTEYKELEVVLSQQDLSISSRRKHTGRKREVKLGIRRVEKLMNAVSNLKSALERIISDVPGVEGVIFIIGSPRRPQYIYEICFRHGGTVQQASDDLCKKTQFVDRLSRKVIRELTSRGVGSSAYSGPSKLFLLVKAPASFSMPDHFLPKRDFQYSTKRGTAIYRLTLKHRAVYTNSGSDAETAASINMTDGASDDLIWFQCRHVIKGLASENPTPEE